MKSQGNSQKGKVTVIIIWSEFLSVARETTTKGTTFAPSVDIRCKMFFSYLFYKMNFGKASIFIILTTCIYGLLYSQFPQTSFGFKQTIDPFYFSLTTMSTVGYGDFAPKTTKAKLLVMTQQCLVLLQVFTILSV